MLVGVDMRKDPEFIDQAYGKEVAGPFILNNLERINRELEGTFNLDNFFLHRYYSPEAGENWGMVISKCDQTVSIKGEEVKLKAHEVIMINRSKKWLPEELHKEVATLGVELVKCFTDKKEFFLEALYQKND